MASRRRTARSTRSSSVSRRRRTELSSTQLASLVVAIVLIGSAGLVAMNYDVQPGGFFTAPVAEPDTSQCSQCLNDFTGFSCTDLRPEDNNFEVLSSACGTAYTSCASVDVCPLLSCGNSVCNIEEAENAQNCGVDCA